MMGRERQNETLPNLKELSESLHSITFLNEPPLSLYHSITLLQQ